MSSEDSLADFQQGRSLSGGPKKAAVQDKISRPTRIVVLSFFIFSWPIICFVVMFENLTRSTLTMRRPLFQTRPIVPRESSYFPFLDFLGQYLRFVVMFDNLTRSTPMTRRPIFKTGPIVPRKFGVFLPLGLLSFLDFLPTCPLIDSVLSP